jgi:hypothetical protein
MENIGLRCKRTSIRIPWSIQIERLNDLRQHLTDRDTLTCLHFPRDSNAIGFALGRAFAATIWFLRRYRDHPSDRRVDQSLLPVTHRSFEAVTAIDRRSEARAGTETAAVAHSTIEAKV